MQSCTDKNDDGRNGLHVNDVKTAFLYREIEEEIYMEVPVDMNKIFSDPHGTDGKSTCYQL